MRLAIYPTRLHFRPPNRAGQEGFILPSVAVDAVASTRENAVAVAQAMAVMVCTRKWGGAPSEVLKDRAMVGEATTAIDGPNAYAIGPHFRITAHPLPSRLASDNVATTSQIFTGLSLAGSQHVIIDAAMLSCADSMGVAALIEHREKLHIHLFRPTPSMIKLLGQLRLNLVLGLHPNLAEALQIVATNAPHPLQRTPTPRTTISGPT